MKKKTITITYSDGAINMYADVPSYKVFDNNIVIDIDLSSNRKVYVPFSNVRSFEIVDVK